MATYSEIYSLREDPDLVSRTVIACTVAAHIILSGEDTGAPWSSSNHANRVTWAKKVLADPWTESVRMYWGLLAANKDAPLATIKSVTDSTIQDLVNSNVDLFTI